MANEDSTELVTEIDSVETPPPNNGSESTTSGKIQIVPLILIMVFGVAIFFMLKQFDSNRTLINLYLIAVISIFVGFCCWFFIGSVEGNEFKIFGIKIKTITGSFFIFLFVFVVGIKFFNPGYLDPIIVFDERNLQGFADKNAIDFKVKILTSKKDAISDLENYSYVSHYTTTVSTSQSHSQPKKLDITVQFPDSIAKSASKIVIYLDNNTYQKLFNPNSNTVPLTPIVNWADLGERDGYHIFQHAFRPTISFSLTFFK